MLYNVFLSPNVQILSTLQLTLSVLNVGEGDDFFYFYLFASPGAPYIYVTYLCEDLYLSVNIAFENI